MSLVFIIRQIWRIKESYRYLLPLIGIINTILYFVIAIGVTNLFDLTIVRFIFGLVLIFMMFNVLGYIFDKTNVFSKDFEKVFEGNAMTTYGIQTQYMALYIARYTKLSVKELDEKIDDHIITRTMEMRK